MTAFNDLPLQVQSRKPGEHETSSPHRGQTKRQGYKSWVGAKERCFNVGGKSYYGYGAKGITMCEGWRYNSEAFLDDMGPKPDPTYSIDRIDNSGNYSCGKCSHCQENGWPPNCKWSTKREQVLNRRPLPKRGYSVTHCPRNHEYTEVNTYKYPGGRSCRACNREKQRERKARNEQRTN